MRHESEFEERTHDRGAGSMARGASALLRSLRARMSMWATPSLLVVGALHAAGCDGTDHGWVCRVDAECASGRCLPDGSCGEPATASADVGAGSRFGDAAQSGNDASADGVSGSDAAATDAGATDAASSNPGGTAAFLCKPDHDGKVDRKEMHFAAGLSAPFRVARDAKFQAAGEDLVGQGKVWDLVGPFEGDEDLAIATLPVQGAWFEADFVGATYAAQLDTGSPLLGVFEATGDRLLLRGVVSPENDLFKTSLTYDPPAVVLQFPLDLGTSFQSVSEVKGFKDGVYSIWYETWSSKVDSKGAVKTPFGNFPALRVQTTLTRKVGVMDFVTRSLAWVAECYGTVASARSPLGASSVDFPVADELRRIAPPKR